MSGKTVNLHSIRALFWAGLLALSFIALASSASAQACTTDADCGPSWSCQSPTVSKYATCQSGQCTSTTNDCAAQYYLGHCKEGLNCGYCGDGTCYSSFETSSTCPSDCGYTCSSQYTSYCTTQAQCQGVGGKWCNNYCSYSVSSCNNQTECTSNGGFWNPYSSGTGGWCSETQQTCSSSNASACTQSQCAAAGLFWCSQTNLCYATQASNPCSSTSCSASNPGACLTQATCTQSAVNGYWCATQNYCYSSYATSNNCGGGTGGNCSSTNYPACLTGPNCTGVGGYWCVNNVYPSGYCFSSSASCTSSNTCSSSNYWGCTTQSACTGVGGKWCTSDNACHSPTYSCTGGGSSCNYYSSSTCTAGGCKWCSNTNFCASPDYQCGSSSECSQSNPSGCITQATCTGSGLFWCGSWCSSTQSACGGSSGYCGNYVCDSGETTSSCPGDCGGGSSCSSTNLYSCPQTQCSQYGGKWCLNVQTPYCTTPSSCPDCTASGTGFSGCYSQSGCTAAGGQWCGSYCSSSCPTCSSTSPGNCTDQTSCTNTGKAYWCSYSGGGGYCQTVACPTCSPNNTYACTTETECKGVGANWCQWGSSAGCSTSSCPVCNSSSPWNCYTEPACKGAGANWCTQNTTVPYCLSSSCPSGGSSTCGNKTCESGETYISCPSDCSSGGGGTGYCGNYICDAGETSTSCQTDCGYQPPPNTCSAANPFNCYDQASCTATGNGNWCTSGGYGSGWCQGNSSPCPVCSSTSPGNCYTESACTSAGNEWCKSSGSTYGGQTGYCNQKGYCPKCTSDNYWNCYDETSCKGVGGQWLQSSTTYSSCFSKDYVPTTCSSNQLWACYNADTCKAAGGNFCGSGYNAWCSTSPCQKCDSQNTWACYTPQECSVVGATWCTPSSQYGATQSYCTLYPSSNCTTTGTATCGNAICEAGESTSTCPSDCKPATNLCGNFICDASNGETSASCPGDCKTNTAKDCGNGLCEYVLGESPTTCSVDCKQTFCGDYVCSLSESQTSCPTDCKPGICGDGICNAGEFNGGEFTCANDCAVVTPLPFPEPIAVCPTPAQLEELKTKAEALGMKADLKLGTNGCLFMDVKPVFDSTEQQVHCEPVKDAVTGGSSYVCTKESVYTDPSQCPPSDPLMESQCLSYGGTPKKSTYGVCAYTWCDFGQNLTGKDTTGLFEEKKFECPAPATLFKVVDVCEAQRYKAYIETKDGCKSVTCQEPGEQYACPKHSVGDYEKLQQDCAVQGGLLTEQFDSKGCGVLTCVDRSTAGTSCAKEAPKEAAEQCALAGGQLSVLTGAEGCITFSYCVTSGRGEEVAVVREPPSTAELLEWAQVLLDLETKLNDAALKVTGLQIYWTETNPSRAHDFESAAKQFTVALQEVRSLQGEIKDSLASGVSKDQAAGFATRLVGVKELVQRALGLMLASPQSTSQSLACAPDDLACFEGHLQTCRSGANVSTAQSDGVYTGTIEGLSEGQCLYHIQRDDGTGMNCRTANYTEGNLGIETFEEDCTGPLLEELEAPTGTTATVGAKPRMGVAYASPKLPGCREVVDAQGNTVLACPLYTKNALQPFTPISGLFGLIASWGK
ncbi:MAG: hypothetical protein HY393_03370 [Candidatus Diapherotrites archaeon]|nr:hypothetical protein [Candidatus Diapherotrites archaeon]